MAWSARGVLVGAAALMMVSAQADEHGRWQQVEDQPDCRVWNTNPQPFERATWSGACVNQLAEGPGRLEWHWLNEDGAWGTESYQGPMRAGRRHGAGIYTWVSGNKYIGAFVEGARTGKGVFAWANGDSYRGDFVDGARTGAGVLTRANGDRYEGDFVNGSLHGRAKITFAHGDSCLGDWREDRLLGTGRGYVAKTGLATTCRDDGVNIIIGDDPPD